MAARPQVITLHRFTDDQALAWLAARGSVVVPCTTLAAQWGWHRNTVGRKLQAWAAAGQIKRRGRCIEVRKSALHSPARPGNLVPNASKLLAFVMISAGCTMAALLLYVNATSWSAFAKSTENAWAFVVLAVVIDLLAALLPVCAKFARFWSSIAIWCIWVVCTGMVLWTAVGFAFGNLGDAAGSREATIDRRAIVQERLGALRKELAGLPPYAVTSQAMADAATEERRRECNNGRYCTRARTKEAAILQARELTIRADRMSTDIDSLQEELKDIPVIASADPQITGGVRAVKLMGYQLDQADASVWRDIIFALVLVLFPGGLIRGGISLLRP